MEAQIFMKFETYVYKIVLDHQPNFHKDPCKDAQGQGVNARSHFIDSVREFLRIVMLSSQKLMI